MNIEPLVGIAALTAALGVAVGILFGRYIWPTSRRSDVGALVNAQAEAARLDQECAGLRSQLAQLYAEHAAVTEAAGRKNEELARLTERVANLMRQTEERAGRNGLLEAERAEAARQAKESGERSRAETCRAGSASRSIAKAIDFRV